MACFAAKRIEQARTFCKMRRLCSLSLASKSHNLDKQGTVSIIDGFLTGHHRGAAFITRLHGLGGAKNMIRSTVVVGTDGTHSPVSVREKMGDE